MRLRIDPQIIEKFPNLSLGIIAAKNINNVGRVPQVEASLRQIETKIRSVCDTETLSTHPRIDVWRKTYVLFGAKPKDHLSSVENLCRMVLRKNDVRHINKLVDMYNLISLRHILPLGGEDLDKIQGDIVLTFAKENEPAVVLLGDKEPRAPHVGEVFYKDDVGAICRRWNWREADRTKLTEETKNCILVIEGLPPVSYSDIENVTSELAALVKEHCGGDVTYKILSKDLLEIDL